ncbi:unnamed protein product [Nezara viridula]|uniref:Uncharacterized protein n=1 Tax=Nezara viridula TaxID=85310 RepID=A0A9P0EEJ3_NEZVI|nr:unnamed protein product [Nezara viridula]
MVRTRMAGSEYNFRTLFKTCKIFIVTLLEFCTDYILLHSAILSMDENITHRKIYTDLIQFLNLGKDVFNTTSF